MGAIAMRIRSKKGVPVLQRGLAVLRKYGADVHLWTAWTGFLNGLQAASYLDTAGTTVATADNPLGLVLDQISGQGTLGAELAPQTSNFNGTSGFSTGNATLSVVGGNLVLTSTVASGAMSLSFGGSAVSGAAYRGSMTVLSNTAQNSAWYFGGVQAQPGNITLTGGTGSASAVQTGNSTQSAFALQWVVSAVGQQVVISAVSIRPVLGILASQATTANKPTLRRGILNLQTYSNALSNAAWQKNNIAVTGGQPDPSGGNAAFLLSATLGSSSFINNPVSLANNQVYTRAVIAKAGLTPNLFLETSNNGGYFAAKFDHASGTVTGGSYTSTSMTPLGGGFYLCLATWTTGSTGAQTANAIYIDNYGAALGNTNLTILASGVILGAITAQQLIQSGGIPPTAGGPAATAGNWGWQGNGTSQQLALSSPVLTLTDDCAVVAGARLDASTGTGYFAICAPASNSGTAARAGVLSVAPNNLAAVYWTNDAGTTFVSNAGTVTPGVPFVLSGVQRSGAAKGRLNGGAWANTVNPAGAATLNAGGIMGANGFNVWNGAVYPVCVIKGTVSDADLLAIERMVGALSGPTGVIF